MGSNADFVLLGVSMVLFGLVRGVCAALEIQALGTADRSVGEGEDGESYLDRLLDDPVHTGLALGLVRALAFAATVATSVQVAVIHLFDSSERGVMAAALFVMASVCAPLLAGKLLAIRSPDRFLGATRFVFYPLIRLLRPLAKVLVPRIDGAWPGVMKLIAVRLVPLRQKLEMLGAQDGGAPDEGQQLMSSIIDFGETRVREVMVPRVDIVGVDASLDTNEAIRIVLDAGHSRVPVYEDSIDRIVGTLYTKDLLRKTVDEEEFSLREIAREAFFVPESKMIAELLTEFKTRKQHLAIVVDEYGGTAGIVTMEDVLEEIVGDIQDEFDAEEELFERIDDDTAVCDAKMRLDELGELLGMEFPEDGPDSLGGLLYQGIGKVPRVGDKQRMNGLEFEIQTVARQRIGKVLIRGLRSLQRGAADQTG
jgi:putative hemolysin